jgi:hypothetical protein
MHDDTNDRMDDRGLRGAVDLDAARGRLEDLLLSLPYDRALPDLPELLDRAGVPADVLHRDDRILKVLHEAVLARPMSRVGEAQHLRTEVELLTLEVEVLIDRLTATHSDPATLAEAAERLAEVRSRLDEIRHVI